jgi:hypothetical protein
MALVHSLSFSCWKQSYGKLKFELIFIPVWSSYLNAHKIEIHSWLKLKLVLDWGQFIDNFGEIQVNS